VPFVSLRAREKVTFPRTNRPRAMVRPARTRRAEEARVVVVGYVTLHVTRLPARVAVHVTLASRPLRPFAPFVPSLPFAPGAPLLPGAPAGPPAPGAPLLPFVPGAPFVPLLPGAPLVPGAPAGPGIAGPADPADPAGPGEPPPGNVLGRRPLSTPKMSV
jgi:hypothetical protein